MLQLSHLENIKNKLSDISSLDELEKEERQLYNLIEKHYTLYVGIDVSQDDFSINVKKASCETIYQDTFDNHHSGFCQLLEAFNSVNEAGEFKFAVAISAGVAVSNFPLKNGSSARLSHAVFMIANCIRRYDQRLKALYTRVKGRHQKAGKTKGVAHLIANCAKSNGRLRLTAVAREVSILIYNILKYNRRYYKNPGDYKAYKASLA